MSRQPGQPVHEKSDPSGGDPPTREEGADRGEVTLLLKQWMGGDEGAEEPLIHLVYDELKLLAGRFMRRERADHTLPPTGLVHEAYLRLIHSDLRAGMVENRVHFFAVAAQAMRRILVEHARSYRAERRASPHLKVTFDDRADWRETEPKAAEILAVDEALERLRVTHPRPARVAELRYFAGLTEVEVAEALGISRSSVARDWRLARMLLRRRMGGPAGPSQAGTLGKSDG